MPVLSFEVQRCHGVSDRPGGLARVSDADGRSRSCSASTTSSSSRSSPGSCRRGSSAARGRSRPGARDGACGSLLLLSLTWVMKLTDAAVHRVRQAISGRDLILIAAAALFLIAEDRTRRSTTRSKARRGRARRGRRRDASASVIVQIGVHRHRVLAGLGDHRGRAWSSTSR